ncbi:MAG: DegT/DnrJ/EryC1/StrS family aminotransferase [Methanoregula sp.]|nr:DegT/DnrJ/EryC1/StrS family aminotransferase [Methanoregula sp.]
MDIIPVSRPSLGDKELAAVKTVFDSCWLGLGAQVFEFEQELQKFLGARHAVCTNTGTTAIHLALDALDIGRGDEVIVPSFTYVATAQAITVTGAKPVFCDIHADDLNMDVTDVRKKITKKTKVILPVHYRGFPCDMDEILALAEKNNLHVVEDAAHAFGSSYKGKKIGSFGDIACFSFDPIKNVTCGEGGAVVFQDDALLETIQQKRILGIDKDTWSRYRNERSWFYDVVTQGYRYHMSNISAAVGLVQLKKYDRMNKRKIEVAKRYDTAFNDLEGVTLLKNNGYTDIGLFIYILKINSRRNELMDFLATRGVGSGIHYIPSHVFTYYKKKGVHLPVTEQIYSQILTLPLFADITDHQVNTVIDAVRAGMTAK